MRDRYREALVEVDRLKGYEIRYHHFLSYIDQVVHCEHRCECAICHDAEQELESHRNDTPDMYPDSEVMK